MSVFLTFFWEMIDREGYAVGATRELCVDLDNLIELTKESRAPIRALSLIERAREDLQAYLDEIEGTSGAGRAWSGSG